MWLLLEGCRSAVRYATLALAEGDADAAHLAHVAQATCSEAYPVIATDTVQIHGGIGFTWEHDAHLYLRRAKASEVLFGDSAYHHDAVANDVFDRAKCA